MTGVFGVERLLFLDIDGVLNSSDWFELRGVRQTRPDESLWKIDRLTHDLDPRAVARLNIVLEQTGAKCVLSSTWRFAHGLVDTQRALAKRGFAFELLDMTPDLARQDKSGLFLGQGRGTEIQAWLDAATPVGTCTANAVIAIVDDDSDMGPLLPRLIQTATAYGLTDSEMVRLIHRLR